MGSSPIVWNNAPRKRKRVIPVNKVLPHEVLVRTILSPEVQGVDQHWMNNRAEYHHVGHQLCKWCLEGYPVNKWSGFLLTSDQYGNDRYFLELTDFAFEELMKLKGDRKTLRGMICTFQRSRKNIRSPLIITSNGEVPPHRPLPQAVSAEETIRKLFRLT